MPTILLFRPSASRLRECLTTADINPKLWHVIHGRAPYSHPYIYYYNKLHVINTKHPSCIICLHRPRSTYIHVHIPHYNFNWVHIPHSTFIWVHISNSIFIWVHVADSTFIWVLIYPFHLHSGSYTPFNSTFILLYLRHSTFIFVYIPHFTFVYCKVMSSNWTLFGERISQENKDMNDMA